MEKPFHLITSLTLATNTTLCSWVVCFVVQEIRQGTVEANLVAFAMGNSWISPVDSTLTWGPLLYQMVTKFYMFLS